MPFNIYDQYKRLTPAEQNFIRKNPQHALKIKNAMEVAIEETTRRFGCNGRNDRSDAFRHCYWSALLSRDIGYAKACEFTNAHESYPGNAANEKAMDLHNNSVGLKLGKLGGTDIRLSERCMAALLSGKLIIITK